jgi:hypothetical protein
VRTKSLLENGKVFHGSISRITQEGDRTLTHSYSADANTSASRVYRTDSTNGEWDFVLPTIKLDNPDCKFTAEEGVTEDFSISRLVWALQNGLDRAKLIHYFSHFSENAVAKELKKDVVGFPAIFYAVATNDDKIVRTWVNNGGDVNAVEKGYGFPLLAFAILNSQNINADTTVVVTTLLSLGADAAVVPRAFFTPFLEDPSAERLKSSRLSEFTEENRRWCREYVRPILARTINLSQRYFLEKTMKDKRPSARQIQVALSQNATALLGISYLMIGQSTAAKSATEKLLANMALPKSKPLVMVFAGIVLLFRPLILERVVSKTGRQDRVAMAKPNWPNGWAKS